MDRYNRNILIDGFGVEGQEKLKKSRVLVVGAGGLGAPVLYYLVAAGVGEIAIVDYDVVDETNLQRQILHFTQDTGRFKVISAKEKLEALNPEVKIEALQVKLSAENAKGIIEQYDFIVSCTDNYETKFLVNDVCVSLHKAYSHGAVLALKGEVMTFLPGHSCYRCVFGDMPEEGTMPTSAQAGILGAVAGIVGSIQATEAIKYLVGVGTLILDRILIVDAQSMNFYSLGVEKNKDCLCSHVSE